MKRECLGYQAISNVCHKPKVSGKARGGEGQLMPVILVHERQTQEDCSSQPELHSKILSLIN